MGEDGRKEHVRREDYNFVPRERERDVLKVVKILAV